MQTVDISRGWEVTVPPGYAIGIPGTLALTANLRMLEGKPPFTPAEWRAMKVVIRK